MNDLSLFGIESGLHDLFDAWQNAESPEQLEAAEVAIRACAEAEVRKVDGVRRYWRACEQMAAAAKHEAQVQAERARLWESRLDRLKAVVYEVMTRFERKKLEGQTGSLHLKGNGGKQAVVIHDESLVPDEFCMVTVTMRADWFAKVDNFLAEHYINVGDRTPVSIKRATSNSLIAEALARDCEACAGIGTEPRPIWCSAGHLARFPYGCNLCERFLAQGTTETDPCSVCGGTGKQGVPGARLAERGSHVECR